jgi:hypothetical protein
MLDRDAALDSAIHEVAASRNDKGSITGMHGVAGAAVFAGGTMLAERGLMGSGNVIDSRSGAREFGSAPARAYSRQTSCGASWTRSMVV